MSSTKNYSFGSQGGFVEKIQKALNRIGNFGLTIDGIFGRKTEGAVKDVQEQYGLDVDGIVGKDTQGVLFGDGDSSGSDTTPTTVDNPVFNGKNYTDTDEGEAALEAKNAADAAVAGYGDFTYGNQEQLDAIIQDILNRKDFSYDFNSDAIYQQYKDAYIQQGKMAMQDAIGQASAMTGGYGNSYAATAGNQAYQAHLSELNDVIPELYQMAYDRYTQEGQDMLNKYSLLTDDYGRAYGEYTDKYGRLVDQRDYTSADFYSGADLYNKDRDTANSLAQKEFENALSLNEDDRAERTLAMQEEAWALERSAYEDTLDLGGGVVETGGSYTGNTSTGDTYTGGAKPNYDNEGYSESIVSKAQGILGIHQDGKWGADSASAAKELGYNSLGELISAMTGGTGRFFEGSTYDEACAYLMTRGVTKNQINSLLHTQSDWNTRKSSSQIAGSDSADITAHKNYKEYLESAVLYLTMTYGNK